MNTLRHEKPVLMVLDNDHQEWLAPMTEEWEVRSFRPDRPIVAHTHLTGDVAALVVWQSQADRGDDKRYQAANRDRLEQTGQLLDKAQKLGIAAGILLVEHVHGIHGEANVLRIHDHGDPENTLPASVWIAEHHHLPGDKTDSTHPEAPELRIIQGDAA